MIEVIEVSEKEREKERMREREREQESEKRYVRVQQDKERNWMRQMDHQ